jgi:hypothetical protein
MATLSMLSKIPISTYVVHLENGLQMPMVQGFFQDGHTKTLSMLKKARNHAGLSLLFKMDKHVYIDTVFKMATLSVLESKRGRRSK